MDEEKQIFTFLQHINDTYNDNILDFAQKLKIKIGSNVYEVNLQDYIFMLYQSIERVSFNHRAGDINWPSFMSIIYNNTLKTHYTFHIGEIFFEFYPTVTYIIKDDIRYDVADKTFLVDYLKDLLDVIKNFSVKYSSISLSFTIFDSNGNKIKSHRNMLIFQYDTKLKIYWYEPAGDVPDQKLLKVLKYVVDILKFKLNQDTELLTPGFISCPRGLQTVSNIPYCVMFSYLWLYCCFLILERNINTDMETWVSDIEKYMLKYVNNDIVKLDKLIIGFAYKMIKDFFIYSSKLPDSTLDISESKIVDGYLDIISNKYQRLSSQNAVDLLRLVKKDYKYFLKYYMSYSIRRGEVNYSIMPTIFKRRCRLDSQCGLDYHCLKGFCVRKQPITKRSRKLGEDCVESVDCEYDNCVNKKCVDNIFIRTLYESGMIL